MIIEVDKAHWDALLVEVNTLRAEVGRLTSKLEAIAAALKARGLFAFEHIDGSVTINDR